MENRVPVGGGIRYQKGAARFFVRARRRRKNSRDDIESSPERERDERVVESRKLCLVPGYITYPHQGKQEDEFNKHTASAAAAAAAAAGKPLEALANFAAFSPLSLSLSLSLDENQSEEGRARVVSSLRSSNVRKTSTRVCLSPKQVKALSSVLGTMRAHGHEPEVRAYCAAINAARHLARPDLALEHLTQLRRVSSTNWARQKASQLAVSRCTGVSGWRLRVHLVDESTEALVEGAHDGACSGRAYVDTSTSRRSELSRSYPNRGVWERVL